MRDTSKFWDGVAPGYIRSKIADMPAYEYTLERSISHLTSEMRLLELGCGSGRTAMHMARHVAHVTATDYALEMVNAGAAEAREKGVGNIRFEQAGVDDPALSQTPFDAVMAMNVLHLVPELDRNLKNIHKMLKPGGIFISKTFCLPEKICPLNGSMVKFLLIRAALPVMRILGKAPPVYFMDVRELEHKITAAGFRIIETGNYPARPPSRFIVAERIEVS